MAHNLTTHADGKVEFVSAVTRGWHNIGQLSDRLMTEDEAMALSETGWTVSKRPLFYHDGNELVECTTHKAICRDDNNVQIGMASASYTEIQNREMYQFLAGIVGTGKACWDTAGSLGKGEVVFVNLLLEGSLFLNSNPDDKTEKRIMGLWSHNGRFAPQFCLTGTRVVCQNTLNVALGNRSNVFKIYHRKNYASKMDQAAKALGIASAYFDDLQTVMNTLAEQPVTASYVDGFISALIPAEVDKETGMVATRTQNRRDEIQTLFTSGMGNVGQTRWDLFNAVTEYVDHHQGGRISKVRTERSGVGEDLEATNRFERSILGTGAVFKQKALDLLLDLLIA